MKLFEKYSQKVDTVCEVFQMVWLSHMGKESLMDHMGKIHQRGQMGERVIFWLGDW